MTASWLRSWFARKPEVPDFKYLFVGGCPRSGTSALTNLLNAHEDAAIGMERYPLWWLQNKLNPDLFTSERFLDVREGDTVKIDALRKRLEGFEEKYVNARIVGDKFPNIARKYRLLRDRFEDFRIVFIIRNPFSVALSYQKRFENEEDRFNRDGVKSILDWNASSRNTIGAIEDGMPITVVLYDRVLASPDNALALFDHLGLNRDKLDMQRLRQVASGRKHGEKKTVEFYETLLDQISMRSAFGNYRKLANEHCILRHLAQTPADEAGQEQTAV